MENVELIKDYLAQSGISANALSKGAGISAAAVSQYLSGKYQGDKLAVENALMSFIEAQKDKIQCTAGVVDTDSLRRISAVAQICRANGKLAVVCGRAGSGKTTACKNYAETNSGTVYLYADVSCSAQELFADLVSALKIKPVYQLRQNYKTARNILSGSRRLIIIDEANHLPYKALEMIRAIYDTTGCGVLLVGTEQLYYNLRGHRGEYEQLYSRVALYQKTVPLTLEEVEGYLSATAPKAKPLANIFHKNSAGNIRILANLVWESIRLAEINKCEISRDTVRAAIEDIRAA